MILEHAHIKAKSSGNAFAYPRFIILAKQIKNILNFVIVLDGEPR